MSFLSDIEKIKEETFWVALFDIIFLISPGFLILFYFKQNIFLDLDSIKLILLSVSIIAPFVFLNFLIIVILSAAQKAEIKSDDTFSFITLGIFFSNIIFYILFLVSCLLNFSFRITMFWLIGIELFFFFLSITIAILAKSKNSKTKN